MFRRLRRVFRQFGQQHRLLRGTFPTAYFQLTQPIEQLGILLPLHLGDDVGEHVNIMHTGV